MLYSHFKTVILEWKKPDNTVRSSMHGNKIDRTIAVFLLDTST